jgi:protein SCO1/2
MALLCVACAAPALDTDRPAALPSSTQHPERSAGTVFDLPSQWRTLQGDSIALRALAGRVNVIAMIYTTCQMTCPLIMGDLHRVESQLTATEREYVRFVLVSLDPERDTPGQMRKWSVEQQLDTTRWWLLTGSDRDTRAFAATLDVRYQRQSDGEISHTNGFSVLDPEGYVIDHHAGLGATDAIITSIRKAANIAAKTP